MPSFSRPCGQIHYERTGSGAQALVFVHGALCDHTDWAPQLAHFGPRLSTLALDLAGHGRSSATPGSIGVMQFADDLIALCGHLGLARVTLVGHSMGCRVLLETARRRPDLVGGLVFIDGAYLTPSLLGDKSAAQRQALADAARARGVALYQDQGPRQRARRGFSQMFFDSRFDPVRDRMIARAEAMPEQVARELMPDFAAWDVLHLEDCLAGMRAPSLALACTYMNAAHERVSLEEGMRTPWLDALALHAPQAQVIRYSGSGHFPMLEQPERVNREIAQFLDHHPLS